MSEISVEVNGRVVTAEIDDRLLLIEFIRDVAGLTGTHNGCMEARCGCCAVELEGDIVKSCNVLARQASGKKVSTIEALSPERVRPVDHITTQTLAGIYRPLDILGIDARQFHPLQRAFHECHALQCGFCTPGMLMVLKNFLNKCPDPTREQVRHALAGNLCRCTGYQHIIDAAMKTAAMMRSASPTGTTDEPGVKSDAIQSIVEALPTTSSTLQTERRSSP